MSLPAHGDTFRLVHDMHSTFFLCTVVAQSSVEDTFAGTSADLGAFLKANDHSPGPF